MATQIYIPQPAPIPNAEAWTTPPGTQSSFSNQPSFQPAPPPTSGDTPGCYWDVPNQVTLAANATYNIPYGTGYLVTGSVVNSAVVQLQIGAIGTWVVIKSLNANDAWHYESDYENLQILNGSAGSTVIILYPARRR